MASAAVLERLQVPEELSARVPAEQRGTGRDDVRLMVSRGTEVSHHAFGEIAGQLRAGDVLVVNTSATLAAALDGLLGASRVVVHFSTRGDDGRWAVELRTPDGRGSTRRRAGGPAGASVRLPGGARLVLEEPLCPSGDRLWWARVRGPLDVPELMRGYGRPSVTRTRSRTSRRPRIRRCSRGPVPTARARRRCRVPHGPSRWTWSRSSCDGMCSSPR